MDCEMILARYPAAIVWARVIGMVEDPSSHRWTKPTQLACLCKHYLRSALSCLQFGRIFKARPRALVLGRSVFKLHVCNFGTQDSHKRSIVVFTW